MGFVNVNASAPGTGNAGRPLAALRADQGHQRVQAVRRHHLQRSADRAQGARRRTRSSVSSYTLSKTDELPGQRRQPAHPATCPRRSATRAWPATTGPTTCRRAGSTTCPSARTSAGRTGGVAGALLGGWQINGIRSVMSGTPIYIVQGTRVNLNAAGSAQYPRPRQDRGRDLPGQPEEAPGRRARSERLPVLRPHRVRRGQHPHRPAAAVRQLAAQPDSGPRLLERRPRPLQVDRRCRGARSCSSASRCSMRSTTRTSRTLEPTSPTRAHSGSLPGRPEPASARSVSGRALSF